MKIIFYISSIVLLISSCNKSSSEKEWIKIKDNCLIDEYQDYLFKYPKTKHLSEITDSLRVFWKGEPLRSWHDDCSGGCFILLINKKGELLFEGRLIDQKELKETIKFSILNSEDSHILTWLINISTDRELESEKYSRIIEIVKESFTEIQNIYSMEQYKRDFDDLNQKERGEIDKKIQMKIVFERDRPLPPGIVG